MTNCLSHGAVDLKQEQVKYFPGELISSWQPHCEELYHCYRISLKKMFEYETQFTDIILAVKCDLGHDFAQTEFELVVTRGPVIVDIVYVGTIHLTTEQVCMGTKFQVTVLRLLIDGGLNKLADAINSLRKNDTLPGVTYLILPSIEGNEKTPVIDWDCLASFFPTTAFWSSENMLNRHMKNCSGEGCARYIHAKDTVVCSCMLANSLVVTPHNGNVYCTTGFFDGLDGNSVMKKNGGGVTYREYYRSKLGIELQYEGESLLRARPIFTVQNYLRGQRRNKKKESTKAWVELPPELCSIILSFVSLGTLYSFSMVPSIMHRVESMLLALNLKCFLRDHCISNLCIPTLKVLKAMTTKNCQEGFSLESLETMGDSFLKYAVSQKLFRENKYHREGLLSTQKDRMVSNNALYKLGCERKVQGFIRHECFDPKTWVIPGDCPGCELEEVSLCTSLKIYVVGSRTMDSKVVANFVEGLIGAYLTTGGEFEALIFMDWLGIDFVEEVPFDAKFIAQPERLVSVDKLESILNYSFRDLSLLVEALTHGSYQLSETPRCYQRLEFLGDSVLDYLITYYMYTRYPDLSKAQLTDLRSSVVNNDCYALTAVKVGLHDHVLHMSSSLREQIKNFVESFEHLSLQSTCGWESETRVPEVLGDVIESLAGAIFVDSGYNSKTVWNCMRPILEPLATPDSIKLQPVKELGELCQSKSYERKTSDAVMDGKASLTVEVIANGISYTDTRTGMNKETAEKLAAKAVLRQLKASRGNL